MKKLAIVIFYCLLISRGVAQTIKADTVTAKAYGGVNGVINVMVPPAPLTAATCNGSADDTAALQAIFNYAFTGRNGNVVMFPASATVCEVTQLNLTNIGGPYGFRIVGETASASYQTVIRCNTTSVCIDMTGDQYVSIENLRIAAGRAKPSAIIRMGKSTGAGSSNGNSGPINTQSLDIDCAGGTYGVYENGGEIWKSMGDTFAGCQYPIALSDAPNCGAVASPFASCPSTIRSMSMSKVDLFDPLIVSGVTAGCGILFDPGRGGSVEDVGIWGGYGQTIRGSTAMFCDKSGTSGSIRGLKIANFRHEPQAVGSGAIAPLMKFTNEVDGLNVQGKYAPASAPASAPLQFGTIQDGFIDVQPGDNTSVYASTIVTCTNSTATEIHDYMAATGGAMANSCPGSTEFYNGAILSALSMKSMNGNVLLCSGTLPTLTSGFNTGSMGASANGTCSFTVMIGSGGAVSTGVIGLPTAKSGWNCFATNGNRASLIQETGGSATSVTLTNLGTTFAATNWTNGDAILISCFGR